MPALGQSIVLSGYIACPTTVGGVTRMASAGDAAKWALCGESEPMLGCCWAIVRDVGPTFKQHWLPVQWVL